jgi:hypothetical protein
MRPDTPCTPPRHHNRTSTRSTATSRTQATPDNTQSTSDTPHSPPATTSQRLQQLLAAARQRVRLRKEQLGSWLHSSWPELRAWLGFTGRLHLAFFYLTGAPPDASHQACHGVSNQPPCSSYAWRQQPATLQQLCSLASCMVILRSSWGSHRSARAAQQHDGTLLMAQHKAAAQPLTWCMAPCMHALYGSGMRRGGLGAVQHAAH